jgi:hypothetical protein
MNYKIIDNFLPEVEFTELKNLMLGPWVEWAYNSFVAMPDSELRNDPYDFQFTHTFYYKGEPRSQWMTPIDPILQKINPSAIVRIKANLQPRTEKIITHQYHLDHNNFDGKTAIFYINTNNGYTIFEDGTKIESVENRLVVFNSNILHTGTTCTDQKVRCLINFMFYQWTNATLLNDNREK